MTARKTKLTGMSEEQDAQVLDWVREEKSNSFSMEERYPVVMAHGLPEEHDKQEEQPELRQEEQLVAKDSTDATGISTSTTITNATALTETKTPPAIPQPEPSPDRDTQAVQDSLSDGKQAIQRRVSSKQRKLSLEEYRATYLQVPHIDNRKPLFVSGELRDKLDCVVFWLAGERRMSASGLVENMVRQHLDIYAEDINQWRRLGDI